MNGVPTEAHCTPAARQVAAGPLRAQHSQRLGGDGDCQRTPAGGKRWQADAIPQHDGPVCEAKELEAVRCRSGEGLGPRALPCPEQSSIDFSRGKRGCLGPSVYCFASRLASAILFTLSLASLASSPAGAQNYHVTYSFTGRGLSAHPIGGLAIDRHGNLFGTSAWGGPYDGPGTLFELKRTASGFLYSDIHNFGDGSDGNFPWDAPTVGPDGTLYGTANGGGAHGRGTVLHADPGVSFCRSFSCA